MIFDNDCAVVGTINFDNRSLFYNFEVVSFLYSRKDIGILADWGEKLIHKSVRYTPAEKPFQIRIENFMRMLSPLV